MGKTYLICNLISFPNTASYLLSQQQTLLDDEGPAEIKFNLEQTNFFKSFNKYNAHHDFKVMKKGRIKNHNFDFFYEPLDFNFYIDTTRSIMLVRIKTDVALDFVSKFNDEKPFFIQPITINFQKIIAQINDISGAWFADLNKHHLKSAGYFGDGVDKSQEYQDAAKIGNISAINFKYPAKFNNEEYAVTISSKGSLYLRESLTDEKEELDVVLEIFDNLLKTTISSNS